MKIIASSLNASLTKCGLGNAINIKSYTSSASPYTIPHDGYIYMVAKNAISDIVEVFFKDGNTYNGRISAAGNGQYDIANMVFVKKGMQVWCVSVGNANNTISYIPLE